MNAARFFGWSDACAASGCAGQVHAPMRGVLYDGFRGHGDPAHCAPPGCAPHLRLTGSHAPTAALTPAPWVGVLTSPPA